MPSNSAARLAVFWAGACIVLGIASIVLFVVVMTGAVSSSAPVVPTVWFLLAIGLGLIGLASLQLWILKRR